MKRYLAFILAVMMLVCCLFTASCGGNTNDEGTTSGTVEQGVKISRSFLAGYEKTVAMGENEMQMSGRVLMNLMSDGTLDIYVGFIGMGSHQTAHYTGTYTLGENAEFDETISFSYTYAEGAVEEVKDAVIIGGKFETPFYMITSMTSTSLNFYETAPVDVDGDVYVGYMTKTGGMGAMVYSYALTMKGEGKFNVSIMQLASVMHVWGSTDGTYVVDGEKVTFTYNVVDDVGEIVKENHVSEGTEYTATGLKVGFNIAQASVQASPATFIKVK
jgi:hypothetical protein